MSGKTEPIMETSKLMELPIAVLEKAISTLAFLRVEQLKYC